jgi:hypothetical protein
VPYDTVAHPYARCAYDKKALPGYMRNKVGFYFVDANKVPQGVVKRGIILVIQLILDYLQKCLELDTPRFVPLSSFYLI